MRALFIIDVQNDFTEGGALAVTGGRAVAAGITEYLRAHPSRYGAVVASRDWHDPVGDNGGHFATTSAPDYVETWPRHCVADTPGAEYHPALDTSLIDVHIRKGQGRPAYSIFDGMTDEGSTIPDLLDRLGVTDIDVVGLATDYCVRASVLGSLASHRRVRVFTDLVAGVASGSSAAALKEMTDAGATALDSASVAQQEEGTNV